jgi:transcriptional antiterminator NusG
MQAFKLGDTVRIKGGPFANFPGVVEKIEESRSILIVRVEIFGRGTSVEVPFSEAEKIPHGHQPETPRTNLN